MHVATSHDFPGRNGKVTITAFVADGRNLPMKPVVALLGQSSGEISLDGRGSLTLKVETPRGDAKTAREKSRDLTRELRRLASLKH